MRAGYYSHTEPGGYISASANASGIAQGFLGPPPPGYCWYLENWTAWANAARAGANIELFVLSTSQVPGGLTASAGDRVGRQDAQTAATILGPARNLASPIFVPENYYLVAFWTGLTSGDLVNLTTQIAVHVLTIADFTVPAILEERIEREYEKVPVEHGEPHAFPPQHDPSKAV